MGDQITIFTLTILTGLIVGLVFDFYRVVYSFFRPRPVVTYITDLLFWAVATVITFGALLLTNWAELRAYVFLGLFGGAVLYFRILSRTVRGLLLHVLRAVHYVLVWIKRIFTVLIFRPAGWIISFATKPVRLAGKKTSKWCKDHFKKPPDENIPPAE